MAKTVKHRQDPAANPRSRAAKRATSPSINVDKSIKDVPRAHGASPMLGVTHASGISKKKKGKQMTRGQRMRQEKGLVRAEAVMDQMEKKVGGAKARLKARQGRKSAWEDINSAASEEQRKMPKSLQDATVTGENQNPIDEREGEDLRMTSSTNDIDGTEVIQHEAGSVVPNSRDSILPPSNTGAAKDEFDLIT